MGNDPGLQHEHGPVVGTGSVEDDYSGHSRAVRRCCLPPGSTELGSPGSVPAGEFPVRFVGMAEQRSGAQRHRTHRSSIQSHRFCFPFDWLERMEIAQRTPCLDDPGLGAALCLARSGLQRARGFVKAASGRGIGKIAYPRNLGIVQAARVVTGERLYPGAQEPA